MNFNNLPESIFEKSYSEQLESTSLEKMYTIEDGFFKCPIVTYYQMRLSGGLFNNFQTNIESYNHDSIDSLIDDFLKNENAVFNFINDTSEGEDFSPIKIESYTILKIQKIIIFKSNDPLSKPFFTNEQQISSEVFMKGDEFIEKVLSHPKFNEYQTRAIEIAEENERIAIQADKERKSNVLKNNYEMWKALNAKKEAGEFNEFLG
jgi:hypothetical protein